MLNKIISGGQTGTDRAGLDVTIKFDIPPWWLDTEGPKDWRWYPSWQISIRGNTHQ